MRVRHTCDTSPCIRPNHLNLGTGEDNLIDRYNRLRVQTPDVPLNDAKREYIRALVDEHGGTVRDAKHALGGVHLGTVKKGLRLGREAWARAMLTV
jgi:hypothetical protein